MSAIHRYESEGRSVISLSIAGLGIIMYSPFAVAHLREGEDYFERQYTNPEDVLRHVTAGTIVGFGTGSPGEFLLEIRDGYPDEAVSLAHQFRLRLGIRVKDSTICFRDLYDLMEWTHDCPEEQQLKIADGYYHVTLCSNPPASGILGDGQRILVYLHPLDRLPELKYPGVPTLR